MVKKQKNVGWLTWLLAVIAIVALVLAIVAINKANMNANVFWDNWFDGQNKISEQTQTQTSESLGILGDAYIAGGGDKASLANYEVKYDENGDLLSQISSEGFLGTEEGFILSDLGSGQVMGPNSDCSCPQTDCVRGCVAGTGCGECICKDPEYPNSNIYKSFQCYDKDSKVGKIGQGTG